MRELYLKKIKILGFKSFADSTVLEFHPGITAIVGPNGCGKSNISDSFRWVLGEQSAKSMRGNKMQDVIFAGTSNRKPLNMSEVTITLGEVGAALKTEYDEVAVTRRIHRSGDSEYLINKRSVRLRDVHDLFMDSGIGKNAFSIFEQGKIEQVIQLSPLERRYIFEEAAGILRFLQRKKEALRRLQQTELNIERVRDIHQEVEKQIIVLERQAEEARVYKKNRSELEALEISLAAARWRNFKNKREALEEKEREKACAFETASHDLEKLDIERQDGNIRLNQAIKELQTYKEEGFKVRSQKEIQVKAWKSQEERIEEMAHKELDWKRELDEMVEKRKARCLEKEQMQNRQKTVDDQFSEFEKLRKEQKEQLAEIEGEVSAIRDRQHSLQKEGLERLQEEKRLESEIKQAALKLEHHQEKVLRLQENQQAEYARLEQIGGQIEKKQQEIFACNEALAELREQHALLSTQVEECSTEIKAAKKRLDQLSHDRAEIRARRNALMRLRDEMDGFSKGTKKILEEAGRKGSALFGKVAGLYEDFPTNGCHQMALSSVMKRYTQTLVVKTVEDFRVLADFANDQKIKDFSVICLEMVPRVDKSDDPDAMLFSMTNHPLTNYFFKDVVVKEGLDALWNSSEREVWITEGMYMDRHRVVFFPSETEENAFTREAELKSLDQKLADCEKSIGQLERRMQEMQEQKQVLQTRLQEIDRSIRQSEVQLIECKYAVERLESDQEKTSRLMEKEHEEILTLQELSQELKLALSELGQLHAEKRFLLQEHQKQVEVLENELHVKIEHLKIRQLEAEKKESAYQKAADEKRKIVHQLNLFEVKDLESLQQERRLEEEIRSIREKKSRIQLNRVDFEQKIVEIEAAVCENDKRCAELGRTVDKRQQEAEEAEKRIARKNEEVKLLERGLHEQGIQRVQIDSACSALESEFAERFRMSMQEAESQAQELVESMEKTERRIRSLRRRIEDAGDINMTSIEEYDKYKERYEFLDRQIEDLKKSSNELVQIITKLDGESRKIFKEIFEQIQKNFRKNFEILFRGGEADLRFTESGDILEAGIEIVAKPPGKKMRAISLMSGGEKCLTAVALLFAIFEVKPAPFCILDEIDAPLDDTNVERFLNVVKQFADRCQFIIITHNKRTMAIADRLFGVSMQERGVSKILSIMFDKNISEKEALEPVQNL